MSNGFASALEISARYIRSNDGATAQRFIRERLRNVDAELALDSQENGYLLNMRQGYLLVLSGIYAIAQRGEG